MSKHATSPSNRLLRSINRTWDWYEQCRSRYRRKGSERSIHDLRVATRRLLAMFDLYGPLLDDDGADTVKKARKRAKEDLGSLGPLRDAQVQLRLLPSVLSVSAPLEPLVKELRSEEKKLSKRRVPARKAGTPKSIRRAVRQIRSLTQKAGTRDETSAALAISLGRISRREFQKVVRLAALVDADEPVTIHRLRVPFKKFRYMREFMASVPPGVSRQQIGSMRRFQAAMGAVQDICVLEKRIASYSETAPAHLKSGAKAALRKVRSERDRRIREFIQLLPELESFREPPETMRSSWRP